MSPFLMLNNGVGMDTYSWEDESQTIHTNPVNSCSEHDREDRNMLKANVSNEGQALSAGLPRGNQEPAKWLICIIQIIYLA